MQRFQASCCEAPDPFQPVVDFQFFLEDFSIHVWQIVSIFCKSLLFHCQSVEPLSYSYIHLHPQSYCSSKVLQQSSSMAMSSFWCACSQHSLKDDTNRSSTQGKETILLLCVVDKTKESWIAELTYLTPLAIVPGSAFTPEVIFYFCA